MIINFGIENFGPIKDRQILSFEAENSKHLEDYYVIKAGKKRLLKMALIYGANASGKTYVLKALDFLRNLAVKPLATKTYELDFEPFLFDPETRNQNSRLFIEFIQNEIIFSYEVAFNKRAVVSEKLFHHKYRKTLIFDRTTNLDKQLTKIKFGPTFRVPKMSVAALESNTLWNNTVLGGYLKTNVEIDFLQETIRWFKNYLHFLVTPGINLDNYIFSLIDERKIDKKRLLKIIRKADFNLSDIEIKPSLLNQLNLELDLEFNYPKLYKLIFKNQKNKHNWPNWEVKMKHLINGKSYDLPFDLESDGTKRFLGLAGLLDLLIGQSKIIPVDELEASLHPDLFRYFILLFLTNARNAQIIATTHNRELLNDRNLIRDDALWITDKTENASTELYSFADFDSSVIRDTTNRLNAYKSGKLGGIPLLSDIYLDYEQTEE